MSPQPLRDPHLRRAAIGAFVPGIYLGAFAIPPLGSVLLWHSGRTWTADPTLEWHLVRALRIQLFFCAAMACLQAVVLAVVWLAAPWSADPADAALRNALFLADAGATGGLWLAMGVLGPVLLLAYGPDAALPDGRTSAATPSTAARPAVVSAVATGDVSVLAPDASSPLDGAAASPTLELSEPRARVGGPGDATRLVEPAS